LFVDEAIIIVQSGRGGNGCVSFRHEKYVPRGGPDGGNGGDGGHVYITVDPQMRTLLDFKYRHKFTASAGSHGEGSGKAGARGEDLYIHVPPGTVVYDDETDQQVADLVVEGDCLLAARGGEGGRGNQMFATSTRQTPRFCENGVPPEVHRLRLELQVLADVGVIGMPNVGKSTFISRVSAAKPKIASYPFTTLEPNLGVVNLSDGRRMVVADMPGLIAGAHKGSGLGDKFLRHVQRAHVLIHMLDAAAVEGRDPLADFEAINTELRLYDQRLTGLPQVVALNKIDLPSAREYAPLYAEELKQRDYDVLAISSATGEGCRELLEKVWILLQETEGLLALSQQREPRKFTVSPPPEIQVRVMRVAEDVFVVRGTVIERVVQRVNLNAPDGPQWLYEQLSKMGIIAQLEQAGIKESDTVFLGQLETEYHFALDMP